MTAASAISRQLDEIGALVMAADEATYTARPIPEISGSIGAHVRHCLDHIVALVAASGARPLSYDRRERGTAVEHDPAEALRSIMRLKAAVERWTGRSMDEPICVTSLLTTSGESVSGWSTLGREVAFVNSHTIHHQAMIAVLLSLSGVEVPEGLGLAPATPRKKSGAV